MLWGRSLGAVSIISYITEYPGRAECVILDSAFVNFEEFLYSMAASV